MYFTAYTPIFPYEVIFRNPMTDDYVAVTIGDDPEAVYYFLLFCKKINCREDIDETFTEYLQYLINKSLEGDN